MKKVLCSKCIILSFLAFCICLFAVPAQAQFGKILDRTIDKTKREAEQRTNKTTDKTIDKGFDKVENVFKKKENRTGAKEEETFEGMDDDDFMTTDAAANEPFNSDFVGTFEMEIESYKAGKKEGTTQKMKYYFDKNKIALEMKDKEKETRVIWDHDANTLALVDPERRTAMVMKQQKIAGAQENVKYEVTRNGDTKFVLGRKCTKYTGVSDEGVTLMWVDESVRFDFSKTMSGMTGNKAKSKGAKPGYMDEIAGFPIEVEYRSNDKKEEMLLMRTTLLNVGTVSDHAFDLSGLEVQDISAFQGN